ncbi:Ig-like domain-containing protein [Nocardioides sp. Iso805N]|uniref:Ig-like domain-containing protein n=1 Tax=Nocardioides sp. Iso805N TaxID=1283287 RepID=UPI0003602429|nr:Ig-like domain-containing protein [Nocardioides sp. Iso805N]
MAALVVVVLTVVGLVSASTADAAAIPNAITSVTTSATNVAQGSKVTFGCAWAVPDGSAAGDTFALQLPGQLQWVGATSFALRDSTGAVVANAQVDGSGLVTFTLTAYVATHQDVHGTCQFSTIYSAATDGSDVNLSFDVGSSVIRVPVQTGTPCQTDCAAPTRTAAAKSTWWNDNAQTVPQSIIQVPPITTDTGDVTVTDLPRPGLALDCSTVSANVGAQLNQWGNVADPNDNALYPAQITCTRDKLTVVWTGLPKGEMADVWVQSIVTDPSLTSYANDGTVQINGQDTPVSSDLVRSDASGDGEGVTPTPTPSSTPTDSASPTSSMPATPTPTASAPSTPEASTSPASLHTPDAAHTSSGGTSGPSVDTGAYAVRSDGPSVTVRALGVLVMGLFAIAAGAAGMWAGRRRRGRV